MSRNLPILYESTVTVFGSNNGLGVLSDCVECTVSETLNEEFELTLRYPVNGVLLQQLTPGRIIYAKPSPSRDAEAFRIYRYGKTIRDTIEFSARHISYDLSGVVVKPFTGGYMPSDAITKLNTSDNYYTECAFTFETDLYPVYDSGTTYNIGDYVLYASQMYKCKDNNVTGDWDSSKWDLIDNQMKVEAPSSVRSLLGDGENTLLGTYGGELKYTGYTVSLLVSRGEDRGATLRYGINLIDASQEKNISEMYTGVIPYANNTETGAVVTLSDPVITLNAKAEYEKLMPLDLSGQFTDTPSETELLTMANKVIAINEYDQPEVSITLTQANLSNFETTAETVIELGDTVHVYYEKLGINVSSKVVSTTYNVLTDKYTEIEIGSVKSTIVRTIAKQTNTITHITNNYYGTGGGSSSGSGGSATAVFG